MTPREKAIELLMEYEYLVNTSFDCEIEYKLPNMKECALVTVDKIIEAIDWHESDTPNNEFNYWNKVKEEIIKI